MKKNLLLLLLFPVLAVGQPALDSIANLLNKKLYTEAEQKAASYVKNNPNDLKGLEILGDSYGYQKKWDDAIAIYKRLVGIDENSANYQYKYGGALGMKALEVSKLEALGLIGDVKDALLKAAELNPKHTNVRWALVELYMQLPGILGGSRSKSLKYADELYNLSKVDGYLAKGYIYEYDDEPELAEKYYKLAIKEGGSLWCYDKLTEFYEKQKQPEKALSNLEEANQKHKRNALHYQIGKVAAEYNIELHKGEQCLITYIKNYTPNDGVPKAWAYYRLAQIYLHKKDKERALKNIDLAISEYPKMKPFTEEKLKILKM
ncbi:tetratricopeptide repeat protein [Flavobacteriaceae bacterium XHP0103]|uniref:tetratricopeptide repeat protein n=1 Tax=Marixanthotalea marina TaxID=2844359 RepID=UPI002989DD0F|nr:tetratricopeptide repeat protein [Marixanthotalea marina]MBU3821211.1 tetratricopeptide repeat protein [Marixanthotalea marina]